VDDGVVELELVSLADVAALDVADEQLGRPLLARPLVHVCPVDPVPLHRPVRKGLGHVLRPNLVRQLPLLSRVLRRTRPRRVAAGTTRAADGAPAVGVGAGRRRRRRWRRADRLDDGAWKVPRRFREGSGTARRWGRAGLDVPLFVFHFWKVVSSFRSAKNWWARVGRVRAAAGVREAAVRREEREGGEGGGGGRGGGGRMARLAASGLGRDEEECIQVLDLSNS